MVNHRTFTALNRKSDILFLIIKLKVWLFISFLSVISMMFSTELSTQPIAFPGAEGGGKYSVGGRGGEVVKVTNLNDSGEGSLREAVNQPGARTIVFDVSGTIMLESRLSIRQDSITIAGQTAPGDGITIGGHEMFIQANHVIIQHIRFRSGDVADREVDALWGRFNNHIMIDHVSASWGIDEVLSIYANDSTTVQWSIISEGLYNSVHDKGLRSYGGIWGGFNTTFHHNLMAHNASRVPRIAGEGTTVRSENLDIRNNIFYNWGINSMYGGENSKVNVVANYYKPGPATRDNVRSRIVLPYDDQSRWYIEGNYVEGDSAISADNWSGELRFFYDATPEMRAYDPFPYAEVKTYTPHEAFNLVLEHAGATLPRRDPIDKRIINEVRTGTATYDGSSELNYRTRYSIDEPTGIIDSQDDVGGWPEMKSEEPPVDSNGDGVPDEWAIANGFDVDTPLNKTYASDGYTYLEKYLHSLSSPITTTPRQIAQIPQNFIVYQNYPNPFNPETNIKYEIPENGSVSVRIYDLQGRFVRELVNREHNAGTYTVRWDGTNRFNERVASSVYFAVVRFETAMQTIKLQLIK